jgi:hypothetical protein
MAASSGLQPSDVTAALDLYRQFFGEFNLLVILRTFPVGIFSLMSGRMPVTSPLGAPTVIQIDSPGHLIGLVLLLTLFGWLMGALYFRWVAALVAPVGNTEPPLPVRRALGQTLLYSLIWVGLAWTLGLPALLVIYILFAINTLLGEGVLLFLAFISLWLIVPVFFSPHGIFIKRQNAVASFVDGFRLSRLTLPTSSLFVLTIFLIGVGLNLLWSVPHGDSWLALVGILGHGFITTALLAASFIYYHDMSAWVQIVLARMRAGMPPQNA